MNLLTTTYHSFSIRLFELTVALKRKQFVLSNHMQTIYTHFLLSEKGKESSTRTGPKTVQFALSLSMSEKVQ